MENYIKCELSGGGSPRHLNTISSWLLLSTTHLAIVDCALVHHLSITNNQNIPYLVAFFAAPFTAPM